MALASCRDIPTNIYGVPVPSGEGWSVLSLAIHRERQASEYAEERVDSGLLISLAIDRCTVKIHCLEDIADCGWRYGPMVTACFEFVRAVEWAECCMGRYGISEEEWLALPSAGRDAAIASALEASHLAGVMMQRGR